MYVPAREARAYYRVSDQTLRDWATDGKINYIRTSGKHHRYEIPDKAQIDSKCYLYARVSSRKQSADLERQIEWLKARYPSYEVITDIGSGISLKRPGFKRVLDELFNRSVKEVVVAADDRFSRFGTHELFTWLFARFGAKLTVLRSQAHRAKSEELANELLEVITIFTARASGSRRYSQNQDNSIQTNPTPA